MVSLRSYYGQLKEKMQASKASGAGADNVFVPQWKYFSDLDTFLCDHLVPKRTLSNITNTDCDEGQSFSQKMPKSRKKRARRIFKRKVKNFIATNCFWGKIFRSLLDQWTRWKYEQYIAIVSGCIYRFYCILSILLTNFSTTVVDTECNSSTKSHYAVTIYKLLTGDK